MKMTSAYANKMIRQYEEEKRYWEEKEAEESSFIAAEGEEPVIPPYDYKLVNQTIKELDEKVCILKHALNISNANARIDVDGEILSVDQILIKMAQLNARKYFFDTLRKAREKERLQMRNIPNTRTMVPEYKYANYDIETVKKDYDEVSKKIMNMQIALDKHNQTVEFSVEI